MADLIGTSGSDNLYGTDEADLIEGLAGFDTLSGGAGDDTIRGGDGDDLIWGGSGSDEVHGEAGNDIISVASSGLGGHAIYASGGDGDDRFSIGLHDDSKLTLDGGAGDDWVTFDVVRIVPEVILGLGRDTVELAGGFGGLLVPITLNDFETGSGGDRIVWQKFLDARFPEMDPVSNPFLTGNLVLVQNGADTLLQISSLGLGDSGNEVGKRGTLLIFRNTSAESFTADNFEGHAPTLLLPGTQVADLLKGSKPNSELIEGLGGNDQLTAWGGTDVLAGGAGNDTLTSGDGDDVLFGGSGNDVYLVNSSGDFTADLLFGGFDLVRSTASYALGSNIEDLVLLGAASIDGTGNNLNNKLTGNASANRLAGLGGNDTLRGGDGADTLLGGEGLDRLDGGAGADLMAGGAGNDSYVVQHDGDLVVETDENGADSGGIDSVESAVSFTLGAFVEHLALTGKAAVDGTGNALANKLAGNSAANVLSGGEGADTLTGGAGDDTLHGDAGRDKLSGGAGADTMFGGAGDDSYEVDDLGDVVREETDGADAGGVDIVSSSVSLALADFFENLTLTGTGAIDGVGNDAVNKITGNGKANILRGEGGDDSLTGGGGDDELIGGSGLDMLTGGSGADRFVLDGPVGGSADRIADFSAAAGDRLIIDGADFGLEPGTLDPALFSGTGAATSAPGAGQFVWDSNARTLSWDADGSGLGKAVLIATFNGAVPLAASDFLVI